MRCRHNHGYGKALEYEKRWEKGARKAIERLIETANAIKPFAA